jgi:hypothetical protein
MMKTYIDHLKADTAEADNLRREEEAKDKHHHADPRVLCDIPLTEQIESLMRSLPPMQRDRPWSMDELVARLYGRFSAHPHPMNVGQALRALGWAQRRDWTRDGGGKRYWEIGA